MAHYGSPSNSHTFSGALRKRGKINKSWKQRWFILDEYEQKLELYDSQQHADKQIHLRDTFKLALVERIEVVLGQSDSQKFAQLDMRELLRENRSLYTKYLVLNTKQSTNSAYTFQLLQFKAARTLTLSALDSKSFIAWLHELLRVVYGGVLWEGRLTKMGGRVKSWTTRHFCLNEYKQMKYYMDATRAQLLGLVDLNQCILITNGKQYSDELRWTLEIQTPQRTWVICAASKQQKYEWEQILKNVRWEKLNRAQMDAYVHANLAQHHGDDLKDFHHTETQDRRNTMMPDMSAMAGGQASFISAPLPIHPHAHAHAHAHNRRPHPLQHGGGGNWVSMDSGQDEHHAVAMSLPNHVAFGQPSADNEALAMLAGVNQIMMNGLPIHHNTNNSHSSPDTPSSRSHSQHSHLSFPESANHKLGGGTDSKHSASGSAEQLHQLHQHNNNNNSHNKIRAYAPPKYGHHLHGSSMGDESTISYKSNKSSVSVMSHPSQSNKLSTSINPSVPDTSSSGMAIDDDDVVAVVDHHLHHPHPNHQQKQQYYNNQQQLQQQQHKQQQSSSLHSHANAVANIAAGAESPAHQHAEDDNNEQQPGNDDHAVLDAWDLHLLSGGSGSRKIGMSPSQRHTVQSTGYNEHQWLNVFTQQTTESQVQYHWRFAIRNYNEQWVLIIGIMDTGFLNEVVQANHAALNKYFFAKSKYGYGVDAKGNLKNGAKSIGQYCAPFKSGDVVDVYFDQRKFILWFGLNGKEYGVACKVHPTFYRCCVAMFGPHHCVQLLSCNTYAYPSQ